MQCKLFPSGLRLACRTLIPSRTGPVKSNFKKIQDKESTSMWMTNEEGAINVGDKLEVLDGFVTNIFVLGTIKVRRGIF